MSAPLLLVHEDPFEGAYVASVLRARGVPLTGPLTDTSAALAMVLGDEVGAAILGTRGHWRSHAALLAATRERAIAVLLLIGRSSGDPPPAELAVLTRPFAGFQAADWACRLMFPT